MDLRSELTETKAERAVIEREVHDQLLQLHALQLQLHAKQGQAEDSDTIKDRLVGATGRSWLQPSEQVNRFFQLCVLAFRLYLPETVEIQKGTGGREGREDIKKDN